jgi:hypothetical protein
MAQNDLVPTECEWLDRHIADDLYEKSPEHYWLSRVRALIAALHGATQTQADEIVRLRDALTTIDSYGKDHDGDKCAAARYYEDIARSALKPIAIG